MDEYLKATEVIDCDSAPVAAKAGELTVGVSDPVEKARALFYFVRDRIPYDMYVDALTREEYYASRTLERGRGFCIQKAVLLCALGRAAVIPSRLCFADIINHRVPEYVKEAMGTNLFAYHGYVEFFLSGRWVKATPAFDLKLCERNGIFPVEFDGEHDSLLPGHDRDGNPHIEYVRSHGDFSDLPYERIIETFMQVYGMDGMKEWHRGE